MLQGEHSAILSTFIKLPFAIKTFILSGKQIQTSLRLISVSLSNVLYCIYDVSVVSRCTLYLNKILFTLRPLFCLFLSGRLRQVLL